MPHSCGTCRAMNTDRKGYLMRVRMKAGITGTRDGSPWPPIGGEIVVPDAEGATLCGQGLAEPVAEPSKPERAVNAAPEKRGRRGRPDAG